jgi:hypothetical protein
MSTVNAMSVLFASVVVGFLAFAIASAFRDARTPYETVAVPVRRPCGCAHCTEPMDLAEEFHLRLWEQEFA